MAYSELSWRPFSGHQAWSWTTLWRGNVFFITFTNVFFYFCHVFYVFNVFIFYLNVFYIYAWWRSALHLLFVAITYGKVSSWLPEKPGKLGDFFSYTLRPPRLSWCVVGWLRRVDRWTCVAGVVWSTAPTTRCSACRCLAGSALSTTAFCFRCRTSSYVVLIYFYFSPKTTSNMQQELDSADRTTGHKSVDLQQPYNKMSIFRGKENNLQE